MHSYAKKHALMRRSMTLKAVISSIMCLYELTSVGFEDGDNGAVFPCVRYFAM